MGRMATTANRRHNQPRFKQALAVNRHRVILGNIMLGQFMGGGHRRALLMTAATGIGNVQRVGRRTGVCGLQDIMLCMAVLTNGGKFVALGDGEAMGTFFISRANFFMTAGTVDRSHRKGMLITCNLSFNMAGDTTIVGVDGFLEGIGIKIETDCLPVFLGGHGLIAMAADAIIIGKGRSTSRHHDARDKQDA